MSKILIEKKTYTIKELATLIGVGEQKNLKRGLTNKLNSMGFVEGEHYSFPKGTRGKVVIMWVPQTAKEKIVYLTRLLGQDVRSEPLGFALFVYHLMESDDFQCRPWEERANWLRDIEGIDVSEKTLRNWCNVLMRTDTLIKDTDTYTWWSTTTINGVKIREELADDDQSIEAYREFNKEFFNREDVKKMDKKTRGERWFSEMWSTFGCKFYKCYAFTFGPWHGDILQELIDTVKEYKEQQ